ncbi:plus-3-domain-containing protein [Paxillus ammoniavirescens]|nr:plus-3-domain-containing protein [Paxillus ammoniavirescens]
MSDSDGDIDDELLELAGATEKKRKRQASGSKQSGTKKRKASMSESEPDNEPESEDEQLNPYPLEGKYEDEADRERLLGMSEIDRENILAERLEQMQKIQDRRKLQEMIKQQKSGSNDAESVAKAAKRQHAARGATKEKSKKLDELKARRKAKDEKKRTRTDSPKRDRSSSPMDMETSSGEEEDGQITKYEEEEEKDRKLYSKQPNPNDEPITLEDLVTCRLTRDMLARICMYPWFEDYVKGKSNPTPCGWVRYLIGQEGNEPVYRLCEVTNLGANLTRPYKINDKTVNQTLELKHGKSVKTFYMDKVSNAAFDPKEFDRLSKTYAADDARLPSKRDLEKKAAQLSKLDTQIMTESDIAAMLARKSQLNQQHSAAAITMERSRLMQAKTLAMRRQDYAELNEIEEKLKELPIVQINREEEESLADKLAKVNERNRKANLEAVRKAELIEAERKRRDRKLAAATGSSTLTPSDPSARLRIIPRTFNKASSYVTPLAFIHLVMNRSTTPNPNPNSTGTPVIQPQSTATARPVSPLPSSTVSSFQTSPGKDKSLEASVIESIEVDLGDF